MDILFFFALGMAFGAGLLILFSVAHGNKHKPDEYDSY